MYKFRTLQPDAQKIIGATLVTERTKLVTPIGNFLRETRLDELPQLINVLKGEMNLIGPRPERPEIYEHFCKKIPGYDQRFKVKPGVIGFSQLFTPHSTPKRLRSLIDRRYLNKNRTQSEEILLLIKAITLLAKKGLVTTWRISSYIWNWITGKAPLNQRRELRRIRLKNAIAFIRPLGSGTESESDEIQCSIIDINKEAILISTKNSIPDIPLLLRLEITHASRRGDTPKRKIVRCEGQKSILRPSKGKGCTNYVIEIQHATLLNEYKYDKYFLRAIIG